MSETAPTDDARTAEQEVLPAADDRSPGTALTAAVEAAARLPSAPAEVPQFLTPTTLAEAKEIARLLADSDFVPKEYRGKPGNVMAAMAQGAEVGLNPMQSLRSIAVVNGRPSMWGDNMLGLVVSSPLCLWYDEGFVDAPEDGSTPHGWARTQRAGQAPREQRFSVDDAAQANLLSKAGPWKEYPKRMCMLRARGFLLRDVYPDLLGGMVTREEAMDIAAEHDERLAAGQAGRQPLAQRIGQPAASSAPPAPAGDDQAAPEPVEAKEISADEAAEYSKRIAALTSPQEANQLTTELKAYDATDRRRELLTAITKRMKELRAGD